MLFEHYDFRREEGDQGKTRSLSTELREENIEKTREDKRRSLLESFPGLS